MVRSTRESAGLAVSTLAVPSKASNWPRTLVTIAWRATKPRRAVRGVDGVVAGDVVDGGGGGVERVGHGVSLVVGAVVGRRFNYPNRTAVRFIPARAEIFDGTLAPKRRGATGPVGRWLLVNGESWRQAACGAASRSAAELQRASMWVRPALVRDHDPVADKPSSSPWSSCCPSCDTSCSLSVHQEYRIPTRAPRERRNRPCRSTCAASSRGASRAVPLHLRASTARRAREPAACGDEVPRASSGRVRTHGREPLAAWGQQGAREPNLLTSGRGVLRSCGIVRTGQDRCPSRAVRSRPDARRPRRLARCAHGATA